MVQPVGENDLLNGPQLGHRPLDPLMEDAILPVKIPCHRQVLVTDPRLNQYMHVPRINRRQISEAAVYQVLDSLAFPDVT